MSRRNRQPGHTALRKNAAEHPAYPCEQICIEPYEAPWLADLGGITLRRQRVEEVDPAEFRSLGRDDILFIERTTAGSQSYAIYIRAPSNRWGDTYLPDFDKILPTFHTLPAT